MGDVTEQELRPGLLVEYGKGRKGFVEDWYLDSKHQVIVQVTVSGREVLNNVPLDELRAPE